MTNMWGVHNDRLTDELVEGGFVSIGWDEMPYDLSAVASSRDDLKAALGEAFPDGKPRAIAGWAGILQRFVRDMQPGDVVVAPYKPDSTINITTGGRRIDIVGQGGDPCRRTGWCAAGPRTTRQACGP